MQGYPHHYTASADARTAGVVKVSAPSLAPIETAPPPQFGGPVGIWSPETLLCAAAADCFVLTFRSVARAARYDWVSLECRVEGTLDRLEGGSCFTRFVTAARLTVPVGADTEKARGLLERAERGCLIANSPRGERTLWIEVDAGSAGAAPAAAAHA